MLLAIAFPHSPWLQVHSALGDSLRV